MSETPPAGATPPAHGGSASPAHPAAGQVAGVVAEPELKPPKRRRRLPAGWGAWLLVLAAAATHLAVTVQTVAAGDLVPAINDLRGEDFFLWVDTLFSLFIRLDGTWDTSRLLALWMLVLMVTSIYTALRAGMSVPQGVLSFIGYAVTSVILVGVATPAVWYVFGGWGPLAAPFVPLVAMTAVAALSLRNSEN